MDTEIKFRVGTEDKARFEAAARGERRSLSDWIRGVCLDASEPDAMSPERQKELLEVSTQKTALFTEPQVGVSSDVPTAVERTLEPKILPNDPKEVVRVVGVDPARDEDRGATVRGKVEKGVLTVDSVETGDTRTRQEKADDFYRANMAKGKK